MRSTVIYPAPMAPLSAPCRSLRVVALIPAAGARRATTICPKVGSDEKQPADEVARTGFEAMMRGDGEVVAGWKNKILAALSHITPAGMLAEQHRKTAEPGSASNH